MSPLKGEVPLGSLGALAPLKSPSPAVLGSSMNSSLGGSSFGVDSLEGSLGRSLGGPKGDQGGGNARFSSKTPGQDPFQQKILGGIKHGGMVRPVVPFTVQILLGFLKLINFYKLRYSNQGQQSTQKCGVGVGLR